MGSPTTSGSINEVGWRFQLFRINDLEMVAQTGIEPLLTKGASRGGLLAKCRPVLTYPNGAEGVESDACYL
jgi:hypothetical protein